MPDCGSQVILCGLPIRFDTYRGCSHLCKYCFAQRKVELRNIKTNETAVSLRAFIEGKRTQDTNWCDWSIPIHCPAVPARGPNGWRVGGISSTTSRAGLGASRRP